MINAIQQLHPQVVVVKDRIAFDGDGNVVEYDLAAVNEIIAASEYQRQRIAEYPPIADYIDGIVKGDQDQVQAYINACLAVKAKYPKPTL